jgi:hypothetical protein
MADLLKRPDRPAARDLSGTAVGVSAGRAVSNRATGGVKIALTMTQW